MSQNKNAVIRYRFIDKCLRRKYKTWKYKELLAALNTFLGEELGSDGITLRMLDYDIQFMRKAPPIGYGAPIIRKDGCIYYSRDEFSIEKSALSQEDAATLRDAIKILENHKELPQYKDLTNLYIKMNGEINDLDNARFISFEKNENLKGMQLLSTLYHAIVNKTVLLIRYKPYFDQAKTDTVHPYFLKEYNNRWFLFAYRESYENVSNMAVDRIESIKEGRNTFRENESFHPETYFSSMVGVTWPANVKHKEEVRLNVAPEQLPYLETKPIHSSQRIVERNENGALVSLELIINYELESLLLSYGEKVEVLAPTLLRQKLANRIEKMRERYVGGIGER